MSTSRVADLVAKGSGVPPAPRPSGAVGAPITVASLRAGIPKRITPGTPRPASSRTSLRRPLLGVLHHAGHRHDRLRLGDALLDEQGARRDRRPRARTSALSRRSAGSSAEPARAGARGNDTSTRLASRQFHLVQRPRHRRGPSIVWGAASTSTRRPRSTGGRRGDGTDRDHQWVVARRADPAAAKEVC